MQIGIDSFVAATVDAAGRAVDPARHLSELLEAITLADEVGLDVFGIGEHHRREFLDSAPTVILAAAAARTRRIRLTSAVTVLSAADPVRVFQEFATLDLLSKGRAEIVAGRGSFIEAFPLFGLELEDYDSLGKGWFEVIAGKSVLEFRRGGAEESKSSKCFGFVQTYGAPPTGSRRERERDS
jgi:alkanesulfonate monooxygenase SsuD/methylene tetrahydromethanopterin reductase-like flavin-dependent oxidoreductase (luciferase family)